MVLGRLFQRARPPAAEQARPVAAEKVSEDVAERPQQSGRSGNTPLVAKCPECGTDVIQTADWFATHYDFDCPNCGARSKTPDVSTLPVYEDPMVRMRRVMEGLKTPENESRGR